jgi:hypothetical protein
MNQGSDFSIQNWSDFVQWLSPHLQSHYSVDEFAKHVNRRPFTVREWCRFGRINASKSMTQSGPTTLWVISHAELERFRREGLLPLRGAECRGVIAPGASMRRTARRANRRPA